MILSAGGKASVIVRNEGNGEGCCAYKAAATGEDCTRTDAKGVSFSGGFDYAARTLLMNIIGFSELLRLKLCDSGKTELVEYLGYIRDAGLKLEELLEEFFLHRNCKPVLSRTALPVAELVAKCREAVAEKATRTGVRLVTEVAPEVASLLVRDILLLEALKGLLFLAVDKAPQGGQVGLRCSRFQEKVLFVVWRSVAPGWQVGRLDGLNKDALTGENERVFVLVRELCKRDGGVFWVEGTLGEVASFCLLLPPAAAGEALAAAPNVSRPKEA